VLGADGPQLAGGLHHHLRQVDRLTRHHPPDVGASEQQQVGHQPAHPLGGAQRRAGRVAEVAGQLAGLGSVGEQLEVRQHARQRRSQLVRGVGDELALAGEHRFRLPTRGVELAEHAVERAGQLGDLIVGGRLRQAARGVARAGDLGGGSGQLGDRRHRPARDCHPGEQGEAGPCQHSEKQEQLDAPDGVLGVGHAAAVLDDHPADRLAVGQAHDGGNADHAIALDRRLRQARRSQRRRIGGRLRDDAFADREDPDHAVVGSGGEVAQPRFDPERVDRDDELGGKLFGNVRHLAIEVGADAVHRQRADRDREGAEDDEGQKRRDARQANPDRQPVEAGRYARRRESQRRQGPTHEGRSRLPGSCAAGAAPLPPRAFDGGWRRTPRSCSSSRTGHSPTPRRAGAGAR
jgi:hypothetical protein